MQFSFLNHNWYNSKRILLILSILLWIASCATVPLTNRKQLSLIPNSQMMSMSFSQYSSFLDENKGKILKGTTQAKMIGDVGARISKAVELYMKERNLASRIEGFQWEFKLIEDETVNAWCMPGGKVVFYTGILPICEGEKGVAMVMGHEIAHAIAEHGGERMSQMLVAQGIAVGVAVATMNKSPQMQAIFNTSLPLGYWLIAVHTSLKRTK